MWFDKRGNVAIITALCLPLMVGGAAFGIEVSFWRYDQVRLQQAADAAAYAATVVARLDGSTATNATLTTAATTAATSNGYNSTTDTLAVNGPSSATPGDPHSVEVVITRVEPPIFTAYVRCMVASWHSSTCSTSMATVKVSSTATYINAGDACVLALSPSASKGADFSGNSSLTLDGCSVMADSLAGDAFNIQGSASLSTPCVYAVGGASLGGTLTLTTCGAVKTGQPPIADPFAAIVMPTAGTAQSFNASTAQCGDTFSSIDIKNTVSLPSCGPGRAYIISGGTFTINGNANLSCSGCTFFLTNGANLKINGNSQMNLSAPTTGTYAGMLFMSDRSNTAGISINGNNSSTITGAIYAPDGNVSYSGNFSGASGCTQIVAQTVTFTGDTGFADNCSAYGMSQIPIYSVVKLSA